MPFETIAVTAKNTDINYDLLSVDGSDTIRRDRTSSQDEPRDLIIRHKASGKPGAVTDRTLISLEDSVLVGDVVKKSVLNITFAVDRGVPQGTTDPGDCVDMFYRMISALVPGFEPPSVFDGNMGRLEAVLRGQAL
jgi:hypothetical protein